jgi:hypothetical protein
LNLNDLSIWSAPAGAAAIINGLEEPGIMRLLDL